MTLTLMMPHQTLQDTAFEDFYPSVLYAIKTLPGSEGFIDQIDRLRREFEIALIDNDIHAFEELALDGTTLLSTLKRRMILPADNYKGMEGRIRCAPELPIFEDAASNTRYSSWYYNEGVLKLIETVETLETKTGVKFNIATRGRSLEGPV